MAGDACGEVDMVVSKALSVLEQSCCLIVVLDDGVAGGPSIQLMHI